MFYPGFRKLYKKVQCVINTNTKRYNFIRSVSLCFFSSLIYQQEMSDEKHLYKKTALGGERLKVFCSTNWSLLICFSKIIVGTDAHIGPLRSELIVGGPMWASVPTVSLLRFVIQILICSIIAYFRYILQSQKQKLPS